MTKVRGPLNSVQVSGKQNNLIWARNQYGSYSRDYVVPSDPGSTAQLLWRNALSGLNTIWGSVLTADQRDGWSSFAESTTVSDRFGNQITLDGKTWFVRLNIHRYAFNTTYRNFPPSLYYAEYFPTISLQINYLNSIEMVIDPVPPGDSLIYVKKISAQNVSRNFCPNVTDGYQWISNSDSSPIELRSNADLSSGTKRYFFRLSIIDNEGRKSPYQYLYQDATKYGLLEANPSSYNALKAMTPTTVYYTDNNTLLNESSGSEARAILRFSIALIPPGRTIIKATLRFYISNTFTATTESVNVYKLLALSINTQCTWNNRIAGNPWSTPGLASGVDYEATAYNVSTPSAGWFEVNVTNIVQDWYDGTSTNYGFFLRKNYPSGSILRFQFLDQVPELAVLYST